MPLISFSIPEHLPMIEAGIRQSNGKSVSDVTRMKRQTIRAPRVYPVNPGDALHLWWKSRSPAGRKLGVVICQDVRSVIIRSDDAVQSRQPTGGIKTFSYWNTYLKKMHFARSDGFDHWADMVAYFRPRFDDAGEFRGQLISW